MTTDNANKEVQQAPSLNVSDLQQLAIIVDVAFRKGLFNAEEAGPVSALYTKLLTFLKQFEKKGQDQKPANAGTEVKE